LPSLVLDVGISTNDHVVVKTRQRFPAAGRCEPALSHLVGKRVLADLFSETMIERIGIREQTSDEVTGPSDRASPPSICIPCIRLEKLALKPLPTPGGAHVCNTASIDKP